MKILEHLQEIEAKWEKIEHSYRLSPYNAPMNRTEERDQVMKAYANGQAYNPQFTYASPPEFPIRELNAFICELHPENHPIERLYKEKARNALLGIKAVKTHSPAVITGETCLKYGLPAHSLISEAYVILERVTEPEEPAVNPLAFISAEKAAIRMQNILERVGMQGWKALAYAPMNADASVNRLDKELRLRQEAKFSSATLRRLLMHEIGVHILRYVNGDRQKIQLFKTGFPGYLATEEGLAVYWEEKAGLLETKTLRKYAGRVVAAHLALSNSFWDVFNALVPLLGADMAFNITVRAKRGFTDTSQPGAHTKDIVYLQGYLQVKEYLRDNLDDLSLLFTGKIGLRHIPLVQSLIEKDWGHLPDLLPQDILTLLGNGD